MSADKNGSADSGVAHSGQARVRRTNATVVVDVLRRNGPGSQAELARATGLSPSTINAIVRGLRRDGAVEVERANGRESLVSLVPGRVRVATVSVNGERLTGALFDFVDRRRIDVDWLNAPLGQNAAPQCLAELVARLANTAGMSVSEIDVVSVGIRGPISRHTGAVSSWAAAELPGWKDVLLHETLQEVIGLPTAVDNDANLAALGEWTWGAARGAESLFYAFCAQKPGGAFIIDGRIYRGGDGLAGEIGHMVVNPAGPLCECGSRGCLTTYVSEVALAAALRPAGRGAVSIAEIISAAREGDLAARGVISGAGRDLGRALGNVAKVMAPQVLVVGGPLSGAGAIMWDSLHTSAEMASVRAVSPSLELRAPQIVADEVILGALAAGLTHIGRAASQLPAWHQAL